MRDDTRNDFSKTRYQKMMHHLPIFLLLPTQATHDERTSLCVILPRIAVEPVAAQLILLQRIQRRHPKTVILDGRGGHFRHVELRG